MSRAADGAAEADTGSTLAELEEELADLRREHQDTSERVGDLARENAILKWAIREIVDADDDHGIDDVPDLAAAFRDDFAEALDLLGDLEGAVDDPETKRYAELSKGEKATLVQDALIREARDTNGHAGTDYKGVRQQFDGRPSPGHAYDVMDVAGRDPGFTYGEYRDQGKLLRVTLEDVDASRINAAVNDSGQLSRRE